MAHEHEIPIRSAIEHHGGIQALFDVSFFYRNFRNSVLWINNYRLSRKRNLLDLYYDTIFEIRWM